MEVKFKEKNEGEASDAKKIGRRKSVPKNVTDGEAIELWNNVMHTLVDSNGKTVRQTPDNVSKVLSRKISKYIHVDDFVYRKFNKTKITCKEIYQAADFSKSKWDRIINGNLTDIERGNVYIVSVWDEDYKEMDLSSYSVTNFKYYYVINSK